jgi:hypothetical protein
MRQIRNGVFETNSSSMHSLVIKKNGGYYTNEELNEDLWLSKGIWEIWSDEKISFGRYPFKCLATFESKVRYAIASLCGYRSDCEEKFKEIENIVTDVVWECNGIKLPERRWSDSGELSYGYVDEDILTPFLNDECISLREFLTNKKYVVIVDGDEYCIWNSMKDAGIINMDKIEKEYN